MDEVVLDGQNGRTLTLRRTTSRDAEAIWSYEATVSFESGTITTVVHDHGDWLGPFIREVADNWKGFSDTKEYNSLEGQLGLSCRHDGLGTVACRVTLGQPWPPAWRVEVELEFGAGAHLQRLAEDVEGFIASSA